MLNEFTPSCDHTQEKLTGRSSGSDAGREEEDHQGDGISGLEAERQARKNKTSKVVRKPTPPCGLDLSCQSCGVWGSRLAQADAQLSPLLPLFISFLSTHIASELDSPASL